MGFGTLFFGYFLILDFAYYGFSDFLAAAIMLYALYKLAFVNKSFKNAMFSMCAFAVFSIFELVIFVLDMFSVGGDLGAILSAAAALRSLLICIFTVLILLGMRDVCYEVELNYLGKRCHSSVLPVFIIYSLSILLETGGNFSFIPTKYLALTGLFVLLATIVIIVVNLISIYSCYMKICMPNETRAKKVRKTPKLIESFKKHEERKQQEYIEYVKAKRLAKKNKSDGKKK